MGEGVGCGWIEVERQSGSFALAIPNNVDLPSVS